MKFSNMPKSELNEREAFRCKHYKNGFVHPACFVPMKKPEEKIGFLDIEASNLKATFGIVYTYCIKVLDGPIIKRSISLNDLYTAKYDKNLLIQFNEDAQKFTRLILHYGAFNRSFDIPFLRTRAVKWGVEFPEYKMMYVGDTYPILRNKFKLHGNRLETACDFFGIPAKEHKLNPDIWLSMITGNKKLMKKALDYILMHNVEDVVALELLWKRIHKYVVQSKTSI